MRTLLVLACSIFLLGLCSCIAPNGNFGSWIPDYTNYNDVGSGTSADPYQIYTAAQLQSLANASDSSAWSAYYTLMNDIDLAGAALPEPIGNSTNGFSGNFNGQYYTISNFSVTPQEASETGVFGTVSGSVVDVTFSQLTISTSSAYSDVGAIGTNLGTVSGVQVLGSSSIMGGSYVGAVVGLNEGTVSSCASDQTTVQGTEEIGGLVGGETSSGSIAQSATGPLLTVSGQSVLGGLVGSETEQSSIAGSYSMSHIEAAGSDSVNIGGLVGYISEASSEALAISNSFAATTMNLSGTATNAGGLVGDLGIGMVDVTYAANEIIAPSSTNVGGLVGLVGSAGNLTDSFAAESSLSGSTTPDPIAGSSSGTISSSTVSFSLEMLCNGNACTAAHGGVSVPSAASYDTPSFLGGNTFLTPPWEFPGGLPMLPAAPQFPLIGSGTSGT